MPLFEYRGISAKGKQVTGVSEADGVAELTSKLKREGIYVTRVTESGGKSPRAGKPQSGSVLSKEVDFSRFFDRVKSADVAVMTRQFATLLKAGVPMVESLAALVDQQESRKLKTMLGQIRERVREGASLADGLSDHRNVFPDLYINMVRVGEASGTLDMVLERLADFLESSVRLKSKITSAMVYPIIMTCVGILIVSLMMAFVVPKMTEMYADMGGDLPLATRLLKGASDLLRATWFVLIPAIFGTVYALRRYFRTEAGRLKWDRFMLRVPVFGRLNRLVAVARFGRTLSTLLSSGVPVLTSLEIVRTIVNNEIMARVIDDARVAVREGDSLASPLKASGQFPPMMTHMITIGEKTGQLEAMLKNVADSYDAEVDAKVSTLTAILEPVMIVGMALMVAFLIAALLMPMLQMNELISVG
ncbi:MAG TPA: type II secretion system inner membrane protein GspF [Myxococcota bacterium]|nr:type II secretion system inner membrane protein GspF [Myxococcota bacterium]HOA12510.1 type II secretion system inner membrane protein GspF [Myxococcota bacterium]HOC99257.1 type II secretion system inner membrane protein GspF [Myxococcota bacterium]HOH75815.1 type II secretion system inner membrane protein GspF [Myxococcota bacterium]HPV03432.1 type II secretion system inner membrane protein GspF [Myxococcota bacterium]